MRVWHKLFPCKFGEPLCKSDWGCRCGKGKGQFGRLFYDPKTITDPFGKKRSGSKSESRADDLARQAQQQAQQTATQQLQQSQLLSAEELARSQALASFERGGAETERQRAEGRFQRTPEQQQILDELAKRAGLSGEELVRQIGPDADRLVSLISQRLQAPPQIPFQDLLGPELQQAQQQVAAFANQRGIVGSGLELEQLGRAGVDLAIREAQFRQQNALVNQQLIQETLNRATGLTEFGAGLQDQAIGEQSDFEQALRNQELAGVGLGEQVLQRGLDRGFSAAEAGLGRGFQARESGLGRGFQAQEAGAQRQFGFNELGLQSLQQRMENARQRNIAIAKALGGVAIGGIAGGFGAIPGIAGGPGGFIKGLGQSATGTGAFSPYAGLQGLLSTDPLLLLRQFNNQRLGSQNINLAGDLSFLAPTPGGFPNG